MAMKKWSWRTVPAAPGTPQWFLFHHGFCYANEVCVLWVMGKNGLQKCFFSTQLGSWVSYDHRKSFRKDWGGHILKKFQQNYVTPAIFWTAGLGREMGFERDHYDLAVFPTTPN